MNFEVTKNGPTVPTGVNPKFFNSIKIPSMANSKFKAGDVVKVTAGKLKLRNEGEKSFSDSNSASVEKGDIFSCTGPVYAENLDKNEHAAVRVFTNIKYTPSKGLVEREKKEAAVNK